MLLSGMRKLESEQGFSPSCCYLELSEISLLGFPVDILCM